MVPVDRARTMFAAMKAVNGNTQYTELTGEGHSISGIVYAKPDLHEWMFYQRKGSVPAAAGSASTGK
jgi:dipeptidyl aminopeptidase/acylaminoacyl peptidase